MDILQEVKDECGITWTDDTTDRRINGIIERAKAILDRYAGSPCSYDNGAERQLLCCLCRYIYNNAAEEFKTNFSDELIQLRLKYEAQREIEKEQEDVTP